MADLSATLRALKPISLLPLPPSPSCQHHQIYAAPLAGGARAVVLLNLHHLGGQYLTSNITVQWQQLGLPAGMVAAVRDLYAERDLGQATDAYTALVSAHDVVVLSITPLEGLQGDTWRPWDQQIYGYSGEGAPQLSLVSQTAGQGPRRGTDSRRSSDGLVLGSASRKVAPGGAQLQTATA